MIARNSVRLLLLVAGACAQQASGQEYRPEYYRPVMPWPPAMNEFYHHDSTASGNYMRGLAALIYAQGAYRVNCAQAAILAEHQRSLALSNHQALFAYELWNRQRLEDLRQEGLSTSRARNDERRIRRQEATFSPSEFQLIRKTSAVNLPQTLRQQSTPALNEHQLNRKTGAIAWPLALQAVHHDTDRSRIEFLFKQLASGTGRATRNIELVGKFVDVMLQDLESNRQQMDHKDYLGAQSFLLGVKFASNFYQPAESTQLYSATH